MVGHNNKRVQQELAFFAVAGKSGDDQFSVFGALENCSALMRYGRQCKSLRFETGQSFPRFSVGGDVRKSYLGGSSPVVMAGFIVRAKARTYVRSRRNGNKIN